MRWTCPKCGKKLEVSNEQLIANDGVIVCPQCLLQAHQPIPKARVTARENQDRPRTTAPSRRRPQQDISFDNNTPPEYKPSTPPPHNTRMKQASTSYRYTGMTGSNDNGTKRPSAPKRPSTGKKKSKKKKDNGMSAWGCLGRTIVFTLILFAAYVFFGLLLETLQ